MQTGGVPRLRRCGGERSGRPQRKAAVATAPSCARPYRTSGRAGMHQCRPPLCPLPERRSFPGDAASSLPEASPSRLPPSALRAAPSPPRSQPLGKEAVHERLPARRQATKKRRQRGPWKRRCTRDHVTRKPRAYMPVVLERKIFKGSQPHASDLAPPSQSHVVSEFHGRELLPHGSRQKTMDLRAYKPLYAETGCEDSARR